MTIDLFDANFYRDVNSDLASVGLTTNSQLYWHFQTYGLNEGRAFSAFADLSFYSDSNPDLAAAGLTSNSQLLDHLQRYGVAEGRKFSPFADIDFYFSVNPDVNNFYGGDREYGLQHLRSYGIYEGRKFSPFVDIDYYLNNNTDVKNYYGGDRLKGLQHMELYGIEEGRKFSPFVDLSLYMNMNSDVSYAYGGSRISSLRHLANYGVAEGRRFAIGYDSNYYRSVNSDLSSFNNLQLLGHFEQYGVNEGRASAQSFNVNYYLSNNADLRNLGFSYLSAFQHFNTYGYSEGRLAATPLLLSGDPGNTLASAFNLDLPRNIYSTTYSDFVGTSDLDDYYKFSLAYTSTISINVSSENQRVRIYLFQDTDNNGVFNTSSDLYDVADGYINTTASISKTLGAGTYFIDIQPFPSGSNTNYTLGLTASSATVTTPRDPGPTIATALPIASGQAFTDFVGFTDSDDYYRFTLGNTSNVNVTVDGLSKNEDVTTYLFHDTDNNSVFGTYSDMYYGGRNISKTLGAGTYFIYIKPESRQDNTNYTLKLIASSATVTTSRDPGSQLATALPIVSGQVFTDFVGSTDSADYYSFTLGNTRNVNVTVNGLSESEDVETYLFQDTNNDGVFNTSSDDIYSWRLSAASPASTVSISTTLGAGTYFIYIKPWSTQDNTNYTLRLLT